LFSKYNLWLFR